MLVMLHGVTGGPATSRGDAQFTGTPRGGEGGLHYSTAVKTTAGRPLTVGSLTRYVRGAAAELLTERSKNFAPHNLRLWLR